MASLSVFLDAGIPLMKILLVSEDWYGSLGHFCRNALQQLEHEVRVFHYRKAYREQTKLLGIPVVRKLQRWQSLRLLNKTFVESATQFAPDLIFVIKGELLSPAALKEIKDRCGSLLANWNPDSPFNPVNSSKDVLASIPIYDCHFTWGKFLIPKLLNAGAKRVEYLPFAYEPKLHKKISISKEEEKELGADVCFVGTWEQPREEILEQLTDCDLAIWGNNWERLKPNSSLRGCWRGRAVYGEGMSKIYAASKIVLNFIREQNGNAHNMRSFEALGWGAFMLTTWTKEQCELFGEGKGIACFENVKELRTKISYYLAHVEERREIAKRGHEIVKGKHTYLNRMRRVIHIVEEMRA